MILNKKFLVFNKVKIFEAKMQGIIPRKIVILGNPNVGKSSLFNRLLKDKIAITSDIEGTTRDINIREIALDYGGQVFYAQLCDTAGLMKKADGIFKNVKKIIFDFIAPRDIILYVISANEGVLEDDLRTFRALKNAVLIVNKIDIQKTENWEYEAFGARKIFYISSLHNRGIKGLKDFLGIELGKEFFGKRDLELETLESAETLELSAESSADSIDSIESPADSADSAESNADSAPNTIRIGIIGRVNVGKSSILNALLGKNRSLVSEIEGTTIDPVSDEITHKGAVLRFVDTAGIRRPSKIEGIEKYALERTKKTLEISDIVLLVLDSSNPLVELDEKISGLSQKYNLGIVICLNKWDIKCAEFERLKREIRRKFAYLAHAPILTISALKNRHIDEIKDAILRVWGNFNRRIPTAQLNEHIALATQRHKIPSHKGKIVKIYYATQIAAAPPQIALVMNKPEALHFSYRRYLANYFREHFDFAGVPIIISARGKAKANLES